MCSSECGYDCMYGDIVCMVMIVCVSINVAKIVCVATIVCVAMIYVWLCLYVWYCLYVISNESGSDYMYGDDCLCSN